NDALFSSLFTLFYPLVIINKQRAFRQAENNKPGTGVRGHFLADREAGNNYAGIPGLLPVSGRKAEHRF
ncbi:MULTISPECIES: hypothetical protein, partial [Salmonella]|uniref:hypothetical protein n=1 Tax=Salmonella TaxID=590 RepID=UPI001C380C92